MSRPQSPQIGNDLSSANQDAVVSPSVGEPSEVGTLACAIPEPMPVDDDDEMDEDVGDSPELGNRGLQMGNGHDWMRGKFEELDEVELPYGPVKSWKENLHERQKGRESVKAQATKLFSKLSHGQAPANGRKKLSRFDVFLQERQPPAVHDVLFSGRSWKLLNGWISNVSCRFS